MALLYGKISNVYIICGPIGGPVILCPQEFQAKAEVIKAIMNNILASFSIPNEKRKKYITIAIAFGVLLVAQVCAIVVSGCFGGTATQDGVNIVGTGGAGEQQSDGESENEEPLDDEFSRTIIVPMLINTEHVMSADFMPNNLVKIGSEISGTSTLQINATVRQAYLVMQADMIEQGMKPPMVISAYRSYARQKELYDAKVAQYGESQKVTAAPGTSEHQYSACIDLSTDGTCQNDFNQLPIGLWIAENSYKYGFVVRYPESKKEITGINYEPWHIRYVGVEHATAMHEMNMCLEEYTEYLWAHYPNAVEEVSPDQFPAPRWAGDTGDSDTPVSSTDA